MTDYVVTCDEDWTEAEEFASLGQARRWAAKHAKDLGGLHRSFRFWKFERRYIPNKAADTQKGNPDEAH